MSTLDSQSQEDTQPVSLSFQNDFSERVKQQNAAKLSGLHNTTSNTTESVSNTYHQGQTGHIDLIGAFEQPTISNSQKSIQDRNDDDLEAVTQIVDVRADIYPESMRFRPPATPTTNGRKHDHAGEVIADPNTTPRLPTNPFAGQIGGLEGMMNASQLFKATQALSSPPLNAIASDGLSERPSPDMYTLRRPSTADPLSSPAKLPRSDMVRSVTEPHTKYISMKESQAERDRLSRMSEMGLGIAGREASDDDFEFDDSQLRRRRVRRKIDQETKDQFMGITARTTPTRSRRGQGYKGRDNRRTNPGRRSSRETTEAVVISSGEPAEESQNIDTEEETEREDENPQMEVDDETDELGDDNKENVATKGVQVPMTESRLNYRNSLAAIAQSSPSHRLIGSPTTPQSLKSTNSHVHQIHTTSERTEGLPLATLTVAIVDSQSSQFHAKVNRTLNDTTMQPQDPGSSPGHPLLIPQSQVLTARFQAPGLNNGAEGANFPTAGSVVSVPSRSPVEPLQPGLSKLPSTAAKETSTSSESRAATQRDHVGDHHVTQVLGSSPPSSPKEPSLLPSGTVQVATIKQDGKISMRPQGSVDEFPKSAATTEAQDPEAKSEIHSDAFLSHPETTITTGAQSTIPETSSASEGCDVPTQAVVSPVKPGSKPLPGTVSAQYSNGSTPFETAQSHQSNQTLRSSARLMERPQHNGSPTSPEMFHPRTITEIAAAPSPGTASTDIDLDINLLTSEDVEYQTVMDQLSPVRKKRRGNHGRSLRENMPSTKMLPTAPVMSSQDNPTENKETIPTSSEPIRSRPTAPQMPSHDSTSNNEGSIPTSSEPISSRPYMGRKVNQLTTTTLPDDTEDASNTRIRPEVKAKPSPRGRPRKIRPISTNLTGTASSSRMRGLGAMATASTPKTVGDPSAQAPSIQPGESAIVAPNRVFAHFNGNVAGYYPATCVGVLGGPEPRFRVRFDDGTVDVINGYGTRRLELRPGDIVKLDIGGARTKSYVVDSTQDLQTPTPITNSDTPSRGRARPRNPGGYPQTDIYGHVTVVVSLKHSKSVDGNHPKEEKISVPVKDVYLTQSLWTHFKDRDYVHTVALDRSITRLQTPSETTSSPSTPSSRTRRFKTAGFSRSLNTSLSARTGGGLFKNMAFAVTNINRVEDQERVKQQILSNGGRILPTGFDELFHIPDLGITSPSKDNPTESEFQPNEAAASLGFTCLVADEHCRRTKYIEALALGIPCLATRWIQDCITKRRILPWIPYLLSSGESSYLGGAVRSRFLQPYDAEKTTLSDVLETRPKLLDGQSVLLIMSKSEEKTMKSHPLITHALGASKVSRAINVDVAAKAIVEAQADDEPWDWVYSHDNEKEVERQLFGGDKTGRKRKRGRESEASRLVGSQGRTKVVGNEFVIQSLILGQLVDMD